MSRYYLRTKSQSCGPQTHTKHQEKKGALVSKANQKPKKEREKI